MNRYSHMFDSLAQKKQGAFIAFTVLYDPNRELSKEIINTLIDAGADALELGIAFSDPLADGPTIQKAGLRALKNNSSVLQALDLVREVRSEYPKIPIGILTYANLVIRQDAPNFYQACNKAGVDSVLVADVPLAEIEPFYKQALAHKINTVLIAPPNLPLERCQKIAEYCQGYTYVVTRSGVTGADQVINLEHKNLLEALKACKAPPAVFGFGISTPEHVRKALNAGAQGVISGSQIVSIIEKNLDQKTQMLKSLYEFVKTMKEATCQK